MDETTEAFIASPMFSLYAGALVWGLLLGAFLLFFRAGR
jgi:hypothetical protein